MSREELEKRLKDVKDRIKMRSIEKVNSIWKK